MKSFRVLSIVLASLAAHVAFAWNDTGHMVVAAIAKRFLSPRLVSEIDWLLQQDASPKSDNFLTAACWADDTKDKVTGPWHYINLHFRTDDKTTSNQPEKTNVVWAINKFTAVLTDKGKSPKERAEALRYLLHFVGDLHQPLHAVARDSDEHPDGDRGGNEFKILPPAFMAGWSRPPTNLHALWDVAGGFFPYTERPLTTEGKASIEKLAAGIVEKYPELSLDNVKQTDPQAWAQESADVARRVVYDLKENEIPSPEYLRKVQDESQKRCAYAGYRLAALLTKAMK